MLPSDILQSIYLLMILPTDFYIILQQTYAMDLSPLKSVSSEECNSVLGCTIDFIGDQYVKACMLAKIVHVYIVNRILVWSALSLLIPLVYGERRESMHSFLPFLSLPVKSVYCCQKAHMIRRYIRKYLRVCSPLSHMRGPEQCFHIACQRIVLQMCLKSSSD